MAVLGARERRAEKILAVDLQPERRKLAEFYGAETCGPEAAKERVMALSQGRGADNVMELVGSSVTERLAFDLLRPGGTLAVAGVHTAKGFSFSPPDAYNKNLTYKVGRCPARAYAERLIPLVQSRKYDLSPLFSHRLPLAQGPGGYRLFANKQENCTKVLLIP
jgi:threonine dehydrogenase-like Zn-dependent dehydrogenase